MSVSSKMRGLLDEASKEPKKLVGEALNLVGVASKLETGADTLESQLYAQAKAQRLDDPEEMRFNRAAERIRDAVSSLREAESILLDIQSNPFAYE